MAKKRNRRKRSGKFLWVMVSLMAAVTCGIAAYGLLFAEEKSNLTKPDELLMTYMNYISDRNYKEMYRMLDVEASDRSVKRNL